MTLFDPRTPHEHGGLNRFFVDDTHQVNAHSTFTIRCRKSLHVLSVRPMALHVVAFATRAAGLPANLTISAAAQTAVFFTVPTHVNMCVAGAEAAFAERNFTHKPSTSPIRCVPLRPGVMLHCAPVRIIPACDSCCAEASRPRRSIEHARRLAQSACVPGRSARVLSRAISRSTG